MLNLNKVIEVGSLRYIGHHYNALLPSETVIAGKTIQSISKTIRLPCYRYGRYQIKNVFIAHDSKKIAYVFVNPSYRNYRKVFLEVVNNIPNEFHVDHILSKSIAKLFGYKYVLLCMIPKKVNVKHGYFEKVKNVLEEESPEICYSDNRVFDKVLSRNPTSRREKKELLKGYMPTSVPTYGLTLKQKGFWNYAFGFNNIDMKRLIKKTRQIELKEKL